MTKKNIDPAPLLWPHPTVLVGAMTDGKPDFTTVAWAGIAAGNPPALAIGLQPHRHSLKGIRENQVFSVNIPSVDIVKETDYCGMISGSKTDKVHDCKFKIFFGKVPSAPLIEQCPINLACEAMHILNLGSHFLVVGKIVEVFLTEECLTGGLPDMKKVRPFVFGPGKYYAIGEEIAEAFKVGKRVKEIK